MSFRKHRPLIWTLIVAFTLAGGLWPVPAKAEPTSKATYHGRTIDLSKSWEGAQACAVLSDEDVRCYDSQAELEKELRSAPENDKASVAAAPAGNGGVSTLSYCLGLSTLWLTLYENTGFGGRALNFRDEGFWQNLSTWSFDNQMSSWDNNTYCDAYASWDANGGGAWLTMSALSSNSNVGATWNNQASAIYIT
jgi:hypothetical protein